MKRIKENKKGFTLAELLIVIAIIAVLIAIAVPVFSASLANSRAQVEAANARSTHAMGTVNYIETGNTSYSFTGDEGKEYTWEYTAGAATATVNVAVGSCSYAVSQASYTFNVAGS